MSRAHACARAPAQRVVSYNVGDEVEVIEKDEGFILSYFEATIVSLLEDGRYEVQYKDIIVNEETKVHLKQVKLLEDLRPLPPLIRTPVDGYKLFQFVDGWLKDRWLAGSIAKRMEDEGTYYNVYFTSTAETITFPSGQLRIHQDFIDGEWV